MQSLPRLFPEEVCVVLVNMATDSGNAWEDLRKQARQLENEIDLKLVSFSKFGTSYSHRDNSTSDTSPLLSNDHMFETMVAELDNLISKLSHINERMGDYTHNLGVNSGSAALLHTMQRHRAILHDYSQEFQKTRSNISAHRQREDLLGTVRKDVDGYRSGVNRRSDLYLKESEHLRNSERLIDEQISIAVSTKENLHSQRNAFSQITKRMQDMANKFPVINSLMQRINLRKRRDALILGSVISACVVFLLWWILP